MTDQARGNIVGSYKLGLRRSWYQILFVIVIVWTATWHELRVGLLFMKQNQVLKITLSGPNWKRFYRIFSSFDAFLSGVETKINVIILLQIFLLV